MSTKFRERNVSLIGFMTFGVLVLLIVGSFQIAKLPFIAGQTYRVEFAEAGGLKTGDPVEVAGAAIGKVTSVGLDGNKVVVKLTAKGVHLGSQSTAAIKTGTLLGARFVELTPVGSGSLDDGLIPLARTTAPYDLAESLTQISKNTSEIDLAQLSSALDTVSGTFDKTRSDWAPALKSVSALSKTISGRDAALRQLFKRAASVTGTFAERSKQITELVVAGNQLLGELNSRRQAIEQMLVATSMLADQVTALIDDNQDQLKPALAELNEVADLLQKNEGNINAAIRRAANFITGIGEGLASGPWFNGHLNLAPGVVGLQQFIPQPKKAVQ